MLAYFGRTHNLKDLKDLNLKDLSADLSTEGRVVGPCWEKLKPKGPKAKMLSPQSLLRKGVSLGHVERN